jgi:hypothetical protein
VRLSVVSTGTTTVRMGTAARKGRGRRIEGSEGLEGQPGRQETGRGGVEMHCGAVQLLVQGPPHSEHAGKACRQACC